MPGILYRFKPNNGTFMTAVRLKIEAFILTGVDLYKHRFLSTFSQ